MTRSYKFRKSRYSRSTATKDDPTQANAPAPAAGEDSNCNVTRKPSRIDSGVGRSVVLSREDSETEQGQQSDGTCNSPAEDDVFTTQEDDSHNFGARAKNYAKSLSVKIPTMNKMTSKLSKLNANKDR